MDEIVGLVNDICNVLIVRWSGIASASSQVVTNAIGTPLHEGLEWLFAAGEETNTAPNNDSKDHLGWWLWEFRPLCAGIPLLILFFLWPLLLTLFMTLASASVWAFWLFTSLVLGVVQVGYAGYQFVMIVGDICFLSVLKAFATVRSQVRHYTVKSGLSSSSSLQEDGRRGRRREWRRLLDQAKDYADFCRIEIQEPRPHDRKVFLQGNTVDAQHFAPKFRLVAVLTWVVTRLSKVAMRPAGEEDNDPDDGGSKSTLDWKGSQQIGSRSEHGTRASPPLRRSLPWFSNHEPLDRRKLTLSYSARELTRMTSFDSSLASSPTFRSRRRRLSEPLLEEEDMELHDDDDAAEEKNEDAPFSWNRLAHRKELESELGVTGGMLLTTTHRLREVRLQAAAAASRNTHTNKLDEQEQEAKLDESNNPSSQLKFLLTSVVKRNHLSVDDYLLDDARSVAECGQYKYSKRARSVLEGYHDEVEKCLECLSTPPTPPPCSDDDDDTDDTEQPDHHELADRIQLVRKLKHNMGRTALMLSGGGAQSLYHVGTIRALVQSGLYQDIPVISGTSGGSVTAAMCAIKKPDELLSDLCVPNFATDYMGNGEMKRQRIRWFPSLWEMGRYWLRHQLLLDSQECKRMADFYWGDITFAEAFQRTGKHVCITVSASRAGSGGVGVQRLLLNHISTPHVTLSSAVAASCALPGVLAPTKLYVKDSHGNQEPFEVDGVEWIDGSVQADLPFQRISTLFNVSNYIVCQTNFHVLPFLHKAHHPDQQSWYWRLFQTCEMDIRNRALQLSRLGLFPKIFGQDLSKVFSQKYHGDQLTLVPRFTTMQVFGLKVLVNPTIQEMELYIQNGQSTAWPHVNVMKEMLRIETAIDRCLTKLEEAYRTLVGRVAFADGLFLDDDLESLSSSGGGGGGPAAGHLSLDAQLTLKRRIRLLEKECQRLRQQVEEFDKEEDSRRRRRRRMAPDDTCGPFGFWFGGGAGGMSTAATTTTTTTRPVDKTKKKKIQTTTTSDKATSVTPFSWSSPHQM